MEKRKDNKTGRKKQIKIDTKNKPRGLWQPRLVNDVSDQWIQGLTPNISTWFSRQHSLVNF